MGGTKLTLNEFQPIGNVPVDNYHNIQTGISEPPSYMVALIMFGMLKLKNYGELDKVLWHTYIELRGCQFMIRDYKGVTWTIKSNIVSNETKELANQIRREILNASHRSDELLGALLADKAQQGIFYINNPYVKLYSFYDFFQGNIRTTLAELDNISLREDVLLDINGLNRTSYLRAAITKYCFALLSSFFSLIEFLLVVFIIFQKSGITQQEYFKLIKNTRWFEIIKSAFPAANDKLMNLITEIGKLKQKYRNPLSHGLQNNAGILVPFLKFGLVPLLYKNWNELNYPHVEIDVDECLKIISVCSEFLTLLEVSPPYCYYMYFLKYGLEIPANERLLSQIKEKMHDMNEFQAYVDMLVNEQDVIRNGVI